MSLTFQTASQEQEFDRVAADWVRKYRSPSADDFALIIQRAHENLRDAWPSISAFERAYRELVAEDGVAVCNEKYAEPQPASPANAPLTAEAYRKLSANEVIRRYRNDRVFKGQIDALVAAGAI